MSTCECRESMARNTSPAMLMITSSAAPAAFAGFRGGVEPGVVPALRHPLPLLALVKCSRSETYEGCASTTLRRGAGSKRRHAADGLRFRGGFRRKRGHVVANASPPPPSCLSAKTLPQNEYPAPLRTRAAVKDTPGEGTRGAPGRCWVFCRATPLLSNAKP